MKLIQDKIELIIFEFDQLKPKKDKIKFEI